MIALLVLLLQAGDPEDTAAAIRRWHEQREADTLVRVEVSAVPGRADLVAALCDWDDRWWGFFSLYHLSHGVVDWEAAISVRPDEQSIHKVTALRIPGFADPIIEVFGKTHMGNGSLYLYVLRGQQLDLLLETGAVDAHNDGQTFRDGCLEPDYVDFNGDGPIDVVLKGVIDEWHEKEDAVLGSRPCRKVCLWNADRGLFVEEPSLELGFSDSRPAPRLPLLLACSSLFVAACFALFLSRR